MVGRLERDILALAGPSLEERRELFDFIVEELARREQLDSARIRTLFIRGFFRHPVHLQLLRHWGGFPVLLHGLQPLIL